MHIKANGDSNALSVEIRPMDLRDIEPIYNLGTKLFTAEKWPTLYRSWDQFEVVTHFEAHDEYCLVAEMRHRVVGFAIGNMMKKPRNPWRYGWLLWLGVEPRYKRHGIGARLVNRLTDLFLADGARMMLVDTDVENTDAIRFFERAGFGNGIHHIYMSLNLDAHPKYRRRKSDRTN